MVNEDTILTYSVDCHHHLRNVWIKGMDLKMTKFLTNILAGDLSEIHFRWRVSTNIVHIMISVDKEFSLPANYPKGHGHEFKFWLNKYHLGVLYWTMILLLLLFFFLLSLEHHEEIYRTLFPPGVAWSALLCRLLPAVRLCCCNLNDSAVK